MRSLLKYMLLSLAAALTATGVFAQERFGEVVEFDRTTHNFGDVLTTDGPLSCTFTLTNISSKPIAIYSVTTTCGCTEVSWTREPIKAGESGEIKVVYSNDEGPAPFDKVLYAYVSDYKKSIPLRIRGISRQKKLALEDIYRVRMGSLGVKKPTIAAGGLLQGKQKSDVLTVANLSSKTVKLSFGEVSDGLGFDKENISIPARSTVDLVWTLTADESRWGFNVYEAELLADGKKAGKITFNASTQEDFTSATREDKSNGSQPMFESSTFTFNRVKAGTPVDVRFNMQNAGKSTLHVYKIDCEDPRLSWSPIKDLPAKGKSVVRMSLDTTGMPSGEVLVQVTLTTNSPLRPVVNLFVAGGIE